MRGLPLLALFSGAVCIALSPIWVRVSEVGPTASAFWRVTLAVPLLWALVFPSRSPSTAGEAQAGTRQWPLLAAAGFAFAGDLAFWHWSIRFTSVANSTLLANLASVFVTLAVWIFWRRRPKALFVAGLAAALAGTGLLVRADLGAAPDALLGDALGVVTAMFYAAYLLAVKRLRDRGAGTLRLMAITTSVTALLLLPVAIASGEALLPATPAGWAKLAGLAWISHAGGQGLIAYALAHLPAAFSAAGLLLQPAIAALFAWMLLGEPLGAPQAAGGAMVLFGIYLAHRGREEAGEARGNG